jgi:hypothetical protein
MYQSDTEKLFRMQFDLYCPQLAVRIIPQTLLVDGVAADSHS